TFGQAVTRLMARLRCAGITNPPTSRAVAIFFTAGRNTAYQFPFLAHRRGYQIPTFSLRAVTVLAWVMTVLISSVYECIDDHGRGKQALGAFPSQTRHNLGRHQTAMGIKSRLFRFA